MAKKQQNIPQDKRANICPFPMCNEHSASGNVPAFDIGAGYSKCCIKHTKFITDTQVARWYIHAASPKRFKLLRKILGWFKRG